MAYKDTPGQKTTLLQRLRSKYRLAISNASTFQEVWGMQLSRLNILVALGLLFIVLTSLAVLVVFFTPIREFVPGYTNTDLTQQVVTNALRADSIHREFNLWDRYLANLRTILDGGVPEPYMETADSSSPQQTAPQIPSEGTSDSALQAYLNIGAQALNPFPELNQQAKTSDLNLIAPVHGEVAAPFAKATQHFGIDIVTAPQAPVMAIADAAVILATWDVNTGYTIALQHSSGLVSIYKHNQRLLKQTGDNVKAGDAIAIVGNSGKFSTGPHLHFELWLHGHPLDPKAYLH